MPGGRKEIDSRGQYLGREDPLDPSDDGDRSIDVIDGPKLGSKADIELFMNEIVTVVVADTTDKNAVRIVSVSINGRTQNFIRGRPQRCRRCYVERLARAKETSYTQDLDPGQGERMNVMYPHMAHSYAFSVIEDGNPKGAAWLRQVLAEAA